MSRNGRVLKAIGTLKRSVAGDLGMEREKSIRVRRNFHVITSREIKCNINEKGKKTGE